MKKAFLLVFVIIPILLAACGKPLFGFEKDNLVLIKRGLVINPGSRNSCKVTSDIAAQITFVKFHPEGSSHHEQTLTVVPLIGDEFPCEKGELHQGYIYSSSVSLYHP